MSRKWECCCLAILAQRAITSVEDEKPNVSGVEPSWGIERTQGNESRGFHKDLNLLPKPLSANDLSSCSKDGSKVRVAYQGLPGAYSEAAALKAYPKCETVPCDQFEEAFKAVELWLVDKAVLPIENSVGGSIHCNYDLLLRHRLNIVGEVQLQVNHCLLGLPGVRKEEIKNVLSHPQKAWESETEFLEYHFTNEISEDEAEDRLQDAIQEKFSIFGDKEHQAIDILLAEIDIYELFAFKHCKGRKTKLALCEVF
ncbi:arogenate dehydratase/prephenate dehydratase 1, chloroplastic isoform X3 [Quercus suber]|uniref:arogenate dehydratase/prephenate dehydratase 1, chloroplastic isoform X3 n=1 Tax=Quercus suber TaxID=58331 RepID=UPI0032DE5009